MAKKKSNIKKILIILAILAIAGAFAVFQVLLAPNARKEGLLYIPTGATYEQVLDSLNAQGFIKNETTFKLVSMLEKYPSNVKAGRYEIRKNMGNFQLVRRLKNGRQKPVKLKFNNIRTVEQLAGRISQQIEADSADLLAAFTNDELLQPFGLNFQTAPSIFIPNTYEFFWNTSAQAFFDRMQKEHDNFWTNERLAKAKKRNITPVEVSIIASIVEEETKKNDEKPLVASVYLNRLRIGMALQADPTVKFAMGDFTIKRIGGEMLKNISPYNTYRYKGLPPGPICIPSISSIDAVLNSAETDYIYFCAKDDLSGYHAFASSYREHQQNAERYRRKLNSMQIR